MEERPPMWRVAVNKSNKEPRTADKGWSSSLGVGRGANNPSPRKTHVKNYPSVEKDRWRALVGTVRDFRGSINAGNFLTSCKVYWLASQEELCSME